VTDRGWGGNGKKVPSREWCFARDRHGMGVRMERKVLSREWCFARDRHRMGVGMERKVLSREWCFARDRHKVKLKSKVLSRKGGCT
jgi:hypothetical protein